jgi:alkaline phosphatase D
MRRFLRRSGAAAHPRPAHYPPGLRIEALEPRSLLSATTVTLGPYVGGVTNVAAQVFVQTSAAADVKIEYSTSPSLSDAKTTSAVATNSASDLTCLVPLAGLAADTTYYYAVLVDGATASLATPPQFTTFAPAGTASDFSFAVTSDIINVQANPTVPAPAYQAIAADNPAFMLQIGDFDHRNATGLTATQNMYEQLLGPKTATGADFAQYIAPKIPIDHLWDDHDTGENNDDDTWTGYAPALQAFKEFIPTVGLANPSAGDWHKFSYGQADVYMLDLRSQRSPDNVPDGPDKSMLDATGISNDELTWFENSLLTSTATWKFVMSSVAFNPETKPSDNWAAFPTAREQLLDFIRDHHITGVIFVSGDIHSGGAIDDGTNSGLPEVSVPHTNLNTDQVTTGPPGVWSQGLISGADGGGYTLIRVLTDPAEVVLEEHAADGKLRMSYTVTLPSTDDTQGPQVAAATIRAPDGSSPGTVSAIVSDWETGGNTVTGAEYFIDTPGADGTGTPLDPTDKWNGPSENAVAQLPAAVISELWTGKHTLYVRGKDALGNWGPLVAAKVDVDTVGPPADAIVVQTSPVTPREQPITTSIPPTVSFDASDYAAGGNNIAAAEYFIDQAGADGTGTPMQVASGAQASPNDFPRATLTAAQFAALPAGTHTIYVHAEDSVGNWGAIAAQTFVVGPATATPTSDVETPSVRTSQTSLDLSWQGTAAAGGAAIASYNIYVSVDGGPFIGWLSATTKTSAVYPARLGHTYGFSSQAEDSGGNLEAMHAAADTVIVVTATPWQNPVNALDVIGNGDAVEPLDALIVINFLNTGMSTLANTAPAGSYYYDVNGNNLAEPLDALIVINDLNSVVAGSPAPSVAARTASPTSSPAGSAPQVRAKTDLKAPSSNAAVSEVVASEIAAWESAVAELAAGQLDADLLNALTDSRRKR